MPEDHFKEKPSEEVEEKGKKKDIEYPMTREIFFKTLGNVSGADDDLDDEE